ncbi:hypothetical protein H072_8150 [Dactylellina haptotyla CBS 200.50]|uniref:Uncharacterized protein n=1 Tax=Dactylellina haptotyla (strain CBS 200.50) TaxID=1284197 RepID=S8A513_DACHA|nr:hypothetical protein H072_8150 [Dactylellina haptotyla CBS 200.50]
MEGAKQYYNRQYERWVPWLEDQYLHYFGKDNKASYVTKQQMDKSKVTGIKQVDKLQDDVHNLAAGQVGKDGLLQPVGDLASKHGINRAERGGKDDNGSYGGPLGGITDPVVGGAKTGGNTAASGVQTGMSKMADGAKGAGGYVGGLSPFGKKPAGDEK